MPDLDYRPGIFPNLGPDFPVEKTPKGPLDRLAYLVGGVWVGSVPDGSGGVTQVREWIRWAVRGWVLYSIQVTEEQGQPPTKGYGLMTQDPCTKLLVMTKIAQESVATGREDPRLTGEPKTVVFVGNTDACTSSLAWRQHLTQVAENKMSTLTELKVEGGYEAMPPVVFTRHPSEGADKSGPASHADRS